MSDNCGTFPMDFAGAARSDGEPAMLYIASDEDEKMEVINTCSVDDLYLSSDDENQLMERCIERQLAEPIPIPSAAAVSTQKRTLTPRPNLPPFPTLGEDSSTWPWEMVLWVATTG